MILLGLGTNRGNRIENLRGALYRLARSNPEKLQVTKTSPVYESDAMLKEGSPPDWNQPYLNMALACESTLEPLALLELLKSVEREMGRSDRERWAPRLIDIDILDWKGKTMKSDRLEVPHAGLDSRPFALLPMTDLVPDHVEWCAIANRWRFARSPDEVPFRTRRRLTALTELVGILNITPDSFSDGGQIFGSAEAVLARARTLVRDGATVLDIGAESTRPGATPVSSSEEWQRLAPILPALKEEFANVAISVDTRNAETAKLALRSGANWINDVTGFDSAEMRDAVRASDARIVVMHHLGVPPQRDRTLPLSDDPVESLLHWGRTKIAQLERAGFDRSRIVLDPGIGFGKTPQQTLSIFENMHRLRSLGVATLIGHSRKSFMTSFTDRTSPERDLETAALSLRAAQAGMDFIRVHDVESNSRVLRAGLSTVREFSFG